MGAAFFFPIIMALIGELVPPEHVGKAIGTLGMAYTIGVTIGPFISGAIDVRYGWPWFFPARRPVSPLRITLLDFERLHGK